MRQIRLFILAALSFTILQNSVFAQGKIAEGITKAVKQTPKVVTSGMLSVTKASSLLSISQNLKTPLLLQNAYIEANGTSQIRVMPAAPLMLQESLLQTPDIKSSAVLAIPTEQNILLTIKATENPAISKALWGEAKILVIDWSKLNANQIDYNLVSEINRIMAAEERGSINGIGIMNCNEMQANDLISLINSYIGSGEEVIRVGVKPAKAITKGTYYLDIQKEINLDELDMLEYNFNTEDVEETKKNTFTRIFNIKSQIVIYDNNKENIISDFAA